MSARRPLACLLLLAALPAGAAEPLVLSEAAAAQRWRASAPRAAAPWPPALREPPTPACVHLGYRIGRDGATGSFVVLREWPGSRDTTGRRRGELLAQSAAAAVSTWRFAPATTGLARKPVFTGAIHVFGATAAEAPALARHCAIDDLGRFVAQAQEAARRRGSLWLGRMDRKRVSDPAYIPDGISPDGGSRHPGWAD
jgi:hypothetical protein